MRRLAELAAKERRRAVGLISGTSADGIDAALVEITGGAARPYEVLANATLALAADLRRDVFALFAADASLDELCRVNAALGEAFAAAVLEVGAQAGLAPADIDLIGSHGQTVWHEPGSSTLQLGEASVIAERSGTTVVADFRPADIAAGGEGAPLVPHFDRAFFGKSSKKAFLNIGGIANVTFPSTGVAFDTGPGNCLIDKWVKMNSKMEFDDRGLTAKSGQSNESILKKFLSNQYYKKKLPKSLDVKDFNLDDLGKLSLKDGCATLSMFTVKSICMAVNSFSTAPNQILFSGGGRKNDFIISNIKNVIKESTYLIDEFNFDGDFIESQAFAYLAIRSYLKKFITFPTTTGVKKPCLGGTIVNS